jgi:hypothetical protein
MVGQLPPGPVRLSHTRVAAMHRQHAFSVGSPSAGSKNHSSWAAHQISGDHALPQGHSQRGREMTVLQIRFPAKSSVNLPSPM